MKQSDGDGAISVAANHPGAEPARSGQVLSPAHQQEPLAAKSKHQNIHVAAAVLDAARKDGDALLRDLRTSLTGLTQADAEERSRAEGPNEIAQERKQGWPIRLLRIMRNPLVILLSTLSAVSFITGDARAGYVMALMVCLSVGLALLSGSPGRRGRGEAQGDDSRDRHGAPRRCGAGDCRCATWCPATSSSSPPAT